MLFSYKDGLMEYSDCEQYQFRGIRFFVKGLFYIPGYKAGAESVQVLSDKLASNSPLDYQMFYGSFIIVIEYSDKSFDIFTDNSHMRCLFVSNYGISSEFLQMIQAERSTTLDKDAVCEYLSVVRTVCTRTLVCGISLSEYDKVYHIKNQKCQVISKHIGDLSGVSTIKVPDEFFRNVAKALTGKKTIAALTGGFDSRLVVANLKNHMDLEVFISGNSPSQQEVVTSEKVAKAGKLDWKSIIPSAPEPNDNIIKALFEMADGRFDNATINGYRVQQFNRQLEKEGYDVILTGEAGDMHKDLWFMQDFPFYYKKKTNIQAFFEKRIEIVPYSRFLSDEAKKRYGKERSETMEHMKRIIKHINSESYDAFGYEIVWNKSSMHNQFFQNIVVYSPLQELDFVRYSYHQPRRKRFFNYNIRCMTTNASPEMARIPTNYGTTSSSEFLYLCRDSFFQFIVYINKAWMLLKKRHLINSRQQSAFDAQIRNLRMTKDAYDYLVKNCYLDEKINFNTVPMPIVSKALYIYLLHLLLQNNRT